VPYFVLEYEVVDNFAERRTPFRPEHLRLVREAHESGELLIAGAVGDPPAGAMLVFRSASIGAAETFAQRDPYVAQGLVRQWRVRPWHVVVGGQ
jgi:uncharacterized protein YciI